MLIAVKLVGILIVVMGIMFLLSPRLLKQYIAYLGKGKRIYLLGILRLVMGVIFVLVAAQCKWNGVITTLGILTLIGGILIFALGLEKVKSMLNWYDRRSALTLRFFGLIALALGALILYSI